MKNENWKSSSSGLTPAKNTNVGDKSFTPQFIDGVLRDKRDEKFLRYECEGISDFTIFINNSLCIDGYLFSNEFNYDFQQGPTFQVKICTQD